MTSQSKFQSIWEYEVRDSFRAEFIEAYDSNGLWAKLFGQCKGYLKTELIEDLNQQNRFITIDYWQSHSAFSVMKNTVTDDYKKLDAQCEAYTHSENHIGFFSIK